MWTTTVDIVTRKFMCVFLGEMKDSPPIIASKAFPLYSKKKKKTSVKRWS